MTAPVRALPAPATDITRPLSEAHANLLRASGLRDDVIASRGYWTATAADSAELARLGHSAAIVAHGAALMLPLHDVYGDRPFTVARPDKPRLDAKGKPRKYETPRGAKLTLDVPPMARPALLDPATTLWITEGQKKADAILSAGAACAIALLGVWAWKKHAMSAWESVQLRERTVTLAFDSDTRTNPKVAQALRRLADFLRGRGAVVQMIPLDAGSDGAKVGIDDALAAGATLEALAAGATADLRVPRTPRDDARPPLDVTTLCRAVTTAAIPHLVQAGVYQSGGRLVRPTRAEGALALLPLDVPGMRGVLDAAVRCERQGATGAAPCYPPRDLAEMIVHEPTTAFPVLRALASSPVFTASGRLLDQPGYDPESHLLLALSWTPRPVPERPTSADLRDARRWWDDEALTDFAFAGPADRTAALALALTPAVRDMIAGPTPLFSLDASTPGAGKGLLARICTLPALGRDGLTSTSLSREEEEVRKALTAYLGERRQGILFDNVAIRIASPSLAKALTEPTWDDRQLGRSASVRFPVRNIWIATGNNLQFSDEIARRAVPIRLVPHTDHPELRTGFRHPALEAWTVEHRADLFWALAVFVRAWQAAGSPTPSTAPLGSYEGWSQVVGGILQHAGYPAFLANRETLLAAADPDTAAWAEFVGAWHSEHGESLVPVRDLLSLAAAAGVYLGGENEKGQATSLGLGLSRRRERLYGPFQILQGSGRSRREWRISRSVTPVTPVTPPSVILTRAHTRAPARAQVETEVGGVTSVTGVTNSSQRGLALAWERVAEAEDRLERAAIQGEPESAA